MTDPAQLHLQKQREHATLTPEDYDRMKDAGCPVCKAQQRP